MVFNERKRADARNGKGLRVAVAALTAVATLAGGGMVAAVAEPGGKARDDEREHEGNQMIFGLRIAAASGLGHGSHLLFDDKNVGVSATPPAKIEAFCHLPLHRGGIAERRCILVFEAGFAPMGSPLLRYVQPRGAPAGRESCEDSAPVFVPRPRLPCGKGAVSRQAD